MPRNPEEQIEMINDYPRRFSLDVSYYNPRCRSCHRKKDNRETRDRQVAS